VAPSSQAISVVPPVPRRGSKRPEERTAAGKARNGVASSVPAPASGRGNTRLVGVSVAIAAAATVLWMLVRGEPASSPSTPAATGTPVAVTAPVAPPPPPRPSAPPVAPPAPTLAAAATPPVVAPTPAAPVQPVRPVTQNPSPPAPQVDPAPRAQVAAEPQAGASGASLTQQAQRLLERGSAGRAAEVARKATTADPQSAEAWLTLGAAYDAAGSRAQAHLAYKNCVDSGRGPRVSECRALLGE
jgi:hypothetical protein